MSQSERKRHIQPSAEQDVGELCHGYHPHMSSLHQQRSDKVHDFVKSFNLAYNKAVKFADPADKMHPGPRMPRMCLFRCMGKGNNEHDVCYTAKIMCMLQAKWVYSKSRLHSVAIC